MDPDERTGTVAYYKSGHDDDDDDIEEVVKVCAYFPSSACIRVSQPASMAEFLQLLQFSYISVQP